jgi:putative ABC transport system ATP-binding protein
LNPQLLSDKDSESLGDAGMTAPVTKLESVTRDFFDGKQTRTVLFETDLEIMPGELTVLAGPSGSGKTTLLTIMGLVLKPTTGRVYVQSEDASDLSEDERAGIRLENFGFVFQQAALVPALSILENLLVSRAIQGRRVTRSMKDEAIRLLGDLGLEDYAGAKPQMLSTGQQQRVGIARALMGSPHLLLCDEPTSALDVDSSRIVLDTLKQISSSEDRGIVLVSHDPRVFPYADRLIKIEDGRIEEDTRGHFGEETT